MGEAPKTPLIDLDPCWGCDDTRYAGYGVRECIKGDVCDDTRDRDWLLELADDIATAIAKVGEARRETREEAAKYLSDAIADLLYDHGGKLNDEEFKRRCGVPTLKEA